MDLGWKYILCLDGSFLVSGMNLESLLLKQTLWLETWLRLLTHLPMFFARFPNGIQNPAELEKNIKLIPGVVENGKEELSHQFKHLYFVACIYAQLNMCWLVFRTLIPVMIEAHTHNQFHCHRCLDQMFLAGFYDLFHWVSFLALSKSFWHVQIAFGQHIFLGVICLG